MSKESLKFGTPETNEASKKMKDDIELGESVDLLIKAGVGEDVFEREEKEPTDAFKKEIEKSQQLKKETPKPKDLGAAARKKEEKEPGEKTILALKARLKNEKNKLKKEKELLEFKGFQNHATPEQIKKQQELVKSGEELVGKLSKYLNEKGYGLKKDIKIKVKAENKSEKPLEKENFIEPGDEHVLQESTPDPEGENLLLEEKVDEEEKATEKKLEAEAKEVEEKIEKMPEEEKKKIGLGLANFGFWTTKVKSDAMAWICEKAVFKSDKPIQEQGAIKRFLASMVETYKKNSEKAVKQMESPDTAIKAFSGTSQIVGGILKYGRTVADVAGWTVGSPLRYAMIGAQLFSRGSEIAKGARLMNKEVIDKTRIDVDKAADEALKIYDQAKIKAGDKKEVSKENLEKAYAENLPQDLLERLKKSEPGTATGILQRILKFDLEFAIKRGKVNETRLKEYDKMVSQYGEIDAWAMAWKYGETAGKAVIAGAQIETAALLMQRLPEIMERLAMVGIGHPEEIKIHGKTYEELKKINVEKQESLRKEVLAAAEKHEAENPKLPEEAPLAQKSAESAKEMEKVFEGLGLKEISIQKGDNLWKIIGNKMHSLESGDYEKLSKGQQIYAIDFIKDKLAAMSPEELKNIGIKSGDINKLNIGDKINLSEIFNKENASNAVERAQSLSPEEIKNIENYKFAPKAPETGNEWVDKKTQEILDKKIAEDLKIADESAREEAMRANLRRGGVGTFFEEKHGLHKPSLEYKPGEYYFEHAKAAEQATILPLSAEKQDILNSLFENKRAGEISTSDVEKLAEQIKKGNILVEDFGNYYASKTGAEKLSLGVMKNLKNDFKIINEGPQAGKSQEYLKAKRAIEVILKRIAEKK